MKDDVLAIVQLPVAREDAALPRQSIVERRSGKRRHDRESRQIDAGLALVKHNLIMFLGRTPA